MFIQLKEEEIEEINGSGPWLWVGIGYVAGKAADAVINELVNNRNYNVAPYQNLYLNR